MDFALDGVKWWSILILEGYSRTILAGTMAPTEATWAALMVLYTACVRYGVFCSTPRKGIFQGDTIDMSSGVTEIWQRWNDHIYLKFQRFTLH
jgi:hypothetical protein